MLNMIVDHSLDWWIIIRALDQETELLTYMNDSIHVLWSTNIETKGQWGKEAITCSFGETLQLIYYWGQQAIASRSQLSA